MKKEAYTMKSTTDTVVSFASDYMEGGHPLILEKLISSNTEKTEGYGTDRFSESAREKIRTACGCPEAQIYFFAGGTQTNAVVIDSVLKPYQGVIAAQSGHISLHEAGAIEYGGHKVLALPQQLGKIKASDIRRLVSEHENDMNREHMVMPGMVYISQPTEYGTLYSRSELAKISEVCHQKGLVLYADGARLAYALASPQNSVTLKELAELCDIFYIGGTKCGALFGEALVITDKLKIPHFVTIMKQHGALFAKGRLLGLQFETLFENDLYMDIGRSAVDGAARISKALKDNGYRTLFDSPTNQVFVVLENRKLAELSKKAAFSFWEKADENHTVMRIAVSWASDEADIDRLIAVISQEA